MRNTVKINATVLLAGSVFLVLSCKNQIDDTGFFTEDMLSVATFLEQNSDDYSCYREIIRTTGIYHALNAYNPSGEGFTLFLPTDNAFQEYIRENDQYNSFTDLLNDGSFCEILAKYHLVNQAIHTTEFPYGVMPDSTATGDYLTISIEIRGDSALYKVNNTATVIVSNIEVSNGYIHVIDKILEPIMYSSYEWLTENEGYSILSDVLYVTGLKDKMDIYRTTASGHTTKNLYTVLAEHDSIFQKAGIHNVDDLINRYASPGLELDDSLNDLYQFAAYHLLEGSYFLGDFNGTGNYNTYAFSPVSIAVGLEIKINKGVDTFGMEIIGTDTSWIDYIGLFYTESNINTKNGPIHLIDQLMEYYQPGRTTRTFEFLEDPIILESEEVAGSYEFVDPDLFELLYWEGPEYILYVKSSGSDENASNQDYLQIEGNFTIRYTMPEIMTGIYKLQLCTDAYNSENATIQVYLDGERIGSNFNLTSGGKSTNPYYCFTIGTVEISQYTEHIIEIKTLIPGIMKWDYVSFIPQ